MDLDIAITYYSRLAEDCRSKADINRNDYMDLKDLATEHEQLADWLNELKVLREKVRTLLEKDRWVPVSERLPEDGSSILVQYMDENMYVVKSCRPKIWNDFIVAWRPAPKPYQGNDNTPKVYEDYIQEFMSDDY